MQGKLLEVLRSLIMRPIEGEWEEWVRQEKEVAQALKAELQGQEETDESAGEEEQGGEEEAESASAMSMKSAWRALRVVCTFAM